MDETTNKSSGGFLDVFAKLGQQIITSGGDLLEKKIEAKAANLAPSENVSPTAVNAQPVNPVAGSAVDSRTLLIAGGLAAAVVAIAFVLARK